jgi:hypothetical protein
VLAILIPIVDSDPLRTFPVSLENSGTLFADPRLTSTCSGKRIYTPNEVGSSSVRSVLGIVANSTLSYAKPEYTKKEKKGCTFCHVSGSSKELNDADKYYKEHDHSLKDYKPAK